MIKTLTFIVKFIIFMAVLWALMALIAYCARDDSDIYTRALMTELHEKDPIDIMFAGASHVSHGINPALLDTLITKNGKRVRTFCSGTPTQHPAATKAIIAETLKTHSELKEVWFECDFAVIQNTITTRNKSPSKSIFLVANYLKDSAIKREYLKSAISPKYFLNALIPIGRDTLLNLDPRAVIRIVRSKISRDYYKNATHPNMGPNSSYGGRGCVLDEDVVKNGTFTTEGDELIKIGTIGDEFYSNIRDIKKMLDEHGARLILYSNPSSDFYLLSRANYDQYVTLIRDFCNEISVPYFDFSFAKPSLLQLTDEDFSDDNHLNISGIDKFTRSFATFYNQMSIYSDRPLGVDVMERVGSTTTNDARRERMSPLYDLFYSSFIQKLADRGARVYGTELTKRYSNAIVVRPIGYNCKNATIKAVAKTTDKSIDLVGVATGESVRFAYPPNTSGVIDVTITLNGEEEAHTSTSYFWM